MGNIAAERESMQQSGFCQSSLEMSPFLCSASFLSWVVFLEKVRTRRLQERHSHLARLLGVAGRLCKFFQSTYSASGTPYRSIHARKASAAAQIVSCSPTAPTSYWSRHPPCRSSCPPVRTLSATRESYHPSVPTHQSVPCAPAVAGAAAASAGDSTTLPLASTAAAPPQRLRSHLQVIFRFQVFRRRRRPKSLAHRPTVLLPHQPQHLRPKLRLVRAIRRSSRAAMLQSRRAFLPIHLPQPLRPAVAHTQQRRRVHHPQLLALHPRQHLQPP